VKKLWNQNQNKSQDKTSQSHKKKGTENIAQVITDGIHINIKSLLSILPEQCESQQGSRSI